MSEKPILFSGQMPQAIIEGKKTQTRRLNGLEVINKLPDTWKFIGFETDLGFPASRGFLWAGFLAKDSISPVYIKCPFGLIYDILWVREKWNVYDGDYGEMGYPFKKIPKEKRGCLLYATDGGDGPWRPSIHMPRWASRLSLLIKNIRVQRLRDISEDDARAEGVQELFTEDEKRDHPEFPELSGYRNYLWHGLNDITEKMIESWPYQYSNYKTAKKSFSSLWEKINGPGSWHSNPWIWAITFNLIK